jgi:hypothetical protein
VDEVAEAANNLSVQPEPRFHWSLSRIAGFAAFHSFQLKDRPGSFRLWLVQKPLRLELPIET